MLKAGGTLQVAMQMGPGPGYPGGPPPPNFFNLPPGGGMYPSMDPSQAGTRAQRGDGSEAGINSLTTLHGLMEGAFWAMPAEQKLFLLAQGKYGWGHAHSRAMAVP